MDQDNAANRKRERPDEPAEDAEESKGENQSRNVAGRGVDNASGSPERSQGAMANFPNLSQSSVASLPFGRGSSADGSDSSGGAFAAASGGGGHATSAAGGAAAAEGFGFANTNQLLSQQGQAALMNALLQPAPRNPTAESLAALHMLSRAGSAPANSIVESLRGLSNQNLAAESGALNAFLQQQRSSSNVSLPPGVVSMLQQASRNQAQDATVASLDANSILQLAAMARNQASSNTPSSGNLLQSVLLNSVINNSAQSMLNPSGIDPALLQMIISSGQSSQQTAAAAALSSLPGFGGTGQLRQQNPFASRFTSDFTNPSLELLNLMGSRGVQNRAMPHGTSADGLPSGGGSSPSHTSQMPSSGGRAGMQASAVAPGFSPALSASGAAPSDALPSPSASVPEVASAPAAEENEEIEEEDLGPPVPSDSESILLYSSNDDTKISPYQCLARQQLEFFVVGQDDLEAGAQGRNRPIELGQVGIRCRHCAQIPHRQKQRASTYFPAKLSGVYQTAQNITNSHLCQLCHCIPASIRRDLKLLQSRKSGTGGGRRYWTESAEACGVFETESGGLRLKREGGDDEEGDAEAA